jgi:hypothetical protein
MVVRHLKLFNKLLPVQSMLLVSREVFYKWEAELKGTRGQRIVLNCVDVENWSQRLRHREIILRLKAHHHHHHIFHLPVSVFKCRRQTKCEMSFSIA